MQVGDVVVGSGGGTVVVNQGIGIPYVVIPEVQGSGGISAGNGLPQEHAAGVDIAVLLRHGGKQLIGFHCLLFQRQAILHYRWIRFRGKNMDWGNVGISAPGADEVGIFPILADLPVIMPKRIYLICSVTVSTCTFMKGIALLCTGRLHLPCRITVPQCSCYVILVAVTTGTLVERVSILGTRWLYHRRGMAMPQCCRYVILIAVATAATRIKRIPALGTRWLYHRRGITVSQRCRYVALVAVAAGTRIQGIPALGTSRLHHCYRITVDMCFCITVSTTGTDIVAVSIFSFMLARCGITAPG